jgi:hypothetical protein
MLLCYRCYPMFYSIRAEIDTTDKNNSHVGHVYGFPHIRIVLPGNNGNKVTSLILHRFSVTGLLPDLFWLGNKWRFEHQETVTDSAYTSLPQAFARTVTPYLSGIMRYRLLSCAKGI